MTEKYFVIIANKQEDEFLNSFRKYLEKNMIEKNLEDGLKKKIFFLWFRYINEINDNITNKYLNNNVYILNFISNINCITNKHLVYKNMEDIFNDSYLEYMPKTFELKHNTKFTKGIYIARPVNYIGTHIPSSKGNDVYVYNNRYKLLLIKKKIKKYDKIIISKYIENPLLFNNKKFHLRIYMTAVIYNNNFSNYLFDMAEIISAKLDYKNEDFGNREIHDTHFDKDFFVFPKTNFGLNSNDIDLIFDKIKNICYKLGIILCKNIKITKNTSNAFHIFGIDIMIDNNLNVYFIECNKNPVLGPNKSKEGIDFDKYFAIWLNDIILSKIFNKDIESKFNNKSIFEMSKDNWV